LLSAETPESKNHNSTGLLVYLAKSMLVNKHRLFAKASSFSFAVLSTAKEKFISSALFASRMSEANGR
jgi:hypothetical protein